MSQGFDLNRLIFALSDALDMSSGDRYCHGKRVALIAVACARQLGLSAKIQSLLFYIGQLRGCGVSGTAMHRKLLHPEQGPDIESHSQAGAQLIAQIPLLAPLAIIVRHHRTPWQALQKLQLGQEVMLLSNLIFIADRANALIVPHLDNPLPEHKEAIRQALNAQRDHLFEPRLLNAFLAASADDTFWQYLEPAHMPDRLQTLLATMPVHQIDLSGVRQAARLFAQVADAKSPYMAGHSQRVGRLASHLGALTGMPEHHCTMLEVAGLLHDLGKLQTPDEILNKVGSLTPVERAQLDRHGLATYRILRKVPGLEKMAVWTAYQHAGPTRIQRGSKPPEAGILAVAEAFQAMLQERPHRPPMTPMQVVGILRQGVARGVLDGQVVEILAKDVDACWSLASGIEVGRWKPAEAGDRARQSDAPPIPETIPPARAEASDESRLVEAVLASGIRIPSMPSALQGLARLRADPDAGPREFAHLINQDMALAGAIFRVAHSPVFHRGIKVDTIEKAVAVLGLKYTEAVITSEALRQALSDPGSAHAMTVLWDHLSAVAELCVWICSKVRIPGITLENAYTIGMFHDCGVALLCKRHPGYADAISRNGHSADIQDLDRKFQSSHTILGQMVGKSWQLPAELTAVIRHHHDPAPPPLPEPAGQMIALLQFALHLRQRQKGMQDDAWQAGWQEVVAERLGVSEQAADALLEDLVRAESAMAG